MSDIAKRFELIKLKLEILKLKADNYNWQCHTPDDVKKQLEEMLVELNEATGTGK